MSWYAHWPQWRHQMETFSALLAICAGNSPVPDVFFDLRLNKRLSKQSWGWWFETPSRPLWRHRNDKTIVLYLWLITYHCFLISMTVCPNFHLVSTKLSVPFHTHHDEYQIPSMYLSVTCSFEHYYTPSFMSDYNLAFNGNNACQEAFFRSNYSTYVVLHEGDSMHDRGMQSF